MQRGQHTFRPNNVHVRETEVEHNDGDERQNLLLSYKTNCVHKRSQRIQ